MPPLDSEPSSQPQRRDAEQCKHVPVGKGAPNRESPGNRLADFGPREIELAGEAKADERPKQKSKNPPERALFDQRVRHGSPYGIWSKSFNLLLTAPRTPGGSIPIAPLKTELFSVSSLSTRITDAVFSP